MRIVRTSDNHDASDDGDSDNFDGDVNLMACLFEHIKGRRSNIDDERFQLWGAKHLQSLLESMMVVILMVAALVEDLKSKVTMISGGLLKATS